MQETLAPGAIFQGKYELLSVLGAGGVGTVYKARQLDFDRVVALKILHPDVAADDEYKARFLREAQSLSLLKHPNIVTVYHLGSTDQGVPYLVMEYISGKSVRALLNESKISDDLSGIPVEQACQIVKAAAKALQYVHSQGIIHRDLKPENLVIEDLPDGRTQVKVIDFGLAHVDLPGDQRLTGTGNLIGTVFYMSPEQCRGQRLDARSDVYSLTVCFYEMITGTHPFMADNPVGMLYQHVNAQLPTLRQKEFSSYQPRLQEMIQHGLQKSPSDRIESMEVLSEYCDRILEQKVKSKDSNKLKLFQASVVLGLLTLLVIAVTLILRAEYEKKRHAIFQLGKGPSAEVRIRRASPVGKLSQLILRKEAIDERFEGTGAERVVALKGVLTELNELIPSLNNQSAGVRFAALKVKYDLEGALGLSEALPTLNKALLVSRRNGVDSVQTAQAYTLLASAQISAGGEDNLKLAEDNLQKASEICRKHELDPGSVPSLNIPGSVDTTSYALMSVYLVSEPARIAFCRQDWDEEYRLRKISSRMGGERGYFRIMIAELARVVDLEAKQGKLAQANESIAQCRKFLLDKQDDYRSFNLSNHLADLEALANLAIAAGFKEQAKLTLEAILKYEGRGQPALLPFVKSAKAALRSLEQK